MTDPDRFCIDCGHPWGATEEICPSCGFDPVNNEEDDNRNEQARVDYRVALRICQQDAHVRVFNAHVFAMDRKAKL
jgi:hypothetical protein